MAITKPLMPLWIFTRKAFGRDRDLHPNIDSYRDLTPKQISKKHENEKKRQYVERVMEVEQGTFTPLVFTTTARMGKYHSRLSELITHSHSLSINVMFHWWAGVAAHGFAHHSSLHPCRQPVQVQDLII